LVLSARTEQVTAMPASHAVIKTAFARTQSGVMCENITLALNLVTFE
jgi:hypothetical protein